jgi:hypothetical protein
LKLLCRFDRLAKLQVDWRRTRLVWNLLNVPGNVPFNPDLNAATGVTTNDVVWNFFNVHPKR